MVAVGDNQLLIATHQKDGRKLVLFLELIEVLAHMNIVLWQQGQAAGAEKVLRFLNDGFGFPELRHFFACLAARVDQFKVVERGRVIMLFGLRQENAF